MDLLKEMNQALTYIEEHLDDELDLAQAAVIARCSEFHFKKMFAYLAGIPLLEYIRRRRLTLAGFELKAGSIKVIDVAMKYGYNSPDSFTKAFYQLHGINPSEVKKLGSSLKAFPRMSFQLTIKGGNPMDYRIEQKEAFTLVGIKERIPLVYHGENPALTEMMKQITDEVYTKLKSLANVEPYGGYNASFNFSDRENEEIAELDHLIGVATTKEEVLGLDSHHVPALTWAIFSVVGSPTDIQEIWGRIYGEWFPSSQYEAIDAPEILYTAKTVPEESNFKSEIWIPVQRKTEAG
ncbi:AraC family transcriptional regulator [Bacillus horti]|uniref:AraC family transcriptional regulator n=1 Tax=Caldalkalibacillus horti TaxID=77523 RepID=A0ABT9VXY9_9BACI|nr:AraC family transcriptional regulator [Bacillus horti]MDQ0165868.1 AraC family transcriptional regulator [Bacillus horti]